MSQSEITASELSSNYKLEIPEHLRHLLFIGLLSGVVGLILIVVMPADQRLFAAVLLVIGIVAAINAALLALVTNRGARLSARHKMMDMVEWRGNEMILDVGCGNGFLLLEAAKHLTTGKAIGIDAWVEGSGGQNADAAWRNAHIEGVADKIDVQNVDARKMPFENETFDVIMSSLALHHMGSNADREQAFREMIRILKPGGTILLYDMFPMIGQAAAQMRRSKFTAVKRLGGFPLVVLSVSK